MSPLFAAGFLSYLTMTLLMLVGLFLMFIILLQRGRGGGLAGAFGGAGGQSAFGTKAGDVFTKITVVVTVLWVALAAASGFALRADAVSNKEDEFKPDTPVVEAPIDDNLGFGDADSTTESGSAARENPDAGLFESLDSDTESGSAAG